MKYKLMILTESSLENHMPHTHADCIILPVSSLAQISATTIIHEMLHVLQRMYPIDFHMFYTNHWKFKLCRTTNNNTQRSNPDVNSLVYTDREMIIIDNTYKYNATDVRHIVDTRDHPNEMFAYFYADKLYNNDILEQHVINLLNG